MREELRVIELNQTPATTRKHWNPLVNALLDNGGPGSGRRPGNIKTDIQQQGLDKARRDAEDRYTKSVSKEKGDRLSMDAALASDKANNDNDRELHADAAQKHRIAAAHFDSVGDTKEASCHKGKEEFHGNKS